jgi:hypothetical protein
MKMKTVLVAMLAVSCTALSVDAATRKKGKASTAANSATLLQQARDAFYSYQPDVAASRLAQIKGAARTDDVEQLAAQVGRMQSMMERVERISVIDSIAVDRNEFLSAYKLSRAAGHLTSPESMAGDGAAAADFTVVYSPENYSFEIWGTDSGLVQSVHYTDGSWEPASPLGDVLNCGGVANFPFMLADGVTLYYATEGDDSLGGYDIYVSRRNGEEYATPQNVGMPYNSPYDDYLLAIDEDAGVGWWATDRNQLPDGKITVYVFIPSDIRVNYPVDAVDLDERARIASYRLTMDNPNVDYAAVLSRLSATDSGYASEPDNDFEFALPDGRVYRHWDDFRSARAREYMETYVDALTDHAAACDELASLRLAYGRGDKSARQRIITLEKQTEAAASALKRLSNQVVNAEMNGGR